MKNLSIKSILAAATFTLIASQSMNASAGTLEETTVHPDTIEVQTVELQYLSGDLATEEGRANLQRRIASAARKVCGSVHLHEAGSLKMVSRNRQCYKESVAAANSQVDHGRQVASSGE